MWVGGRTGRFGFTTGVGTGLEQGPPRLASRRVQGES